MSDYTEHLISMAGGDGEPDLAAIEARIKSDRDDFAGGWSDQTIRDRETLLAMVREQRAVIERVEWIVDKADMHGNVVVAVYAIRAALTATEAP